FLCSCPSTYTPTTEIYTLSLHDALPIWTGKFFAHQHAGIQPHLITTAKGMGNGFPVGGVLIHPDIKPWSGMLGTTFGGNYLAAADRKSTRLNSSHVKISYAVFCLKKKKK